MSNERLIVHILQPEVAHSGEGGGTGDGSGELFIGWDGEQVAVLGITGTIWGPNNKLASWAWNYGDNLIESLFKDDTTIGIFRAFAAMVKGDFSEFAYFTTPEHIMNWLTRASHDQTS